ncbi:MAG: glycosyl hydrolase [Bacteroidota bacterium]
MKYLSIILLALCSTMMAQDQNQLLSESTFSGLKLRNIGPAFASGRIADIAIHPENENIWYVAVGSGGVWKTANGGVTWTPIFDTLTSYSIGCVTIDPNNPHTIWVGTGENVGGRHVGFGDGIYKSEDDGVSWKNMGLGSSEHISKVVVHPENSNIVYVAVQGPLWSEGGERGLYKSKDGGNTWKKVLGDDPWTGVTDLVIDPEDPDWMYAATWQRHRNVAAYMGGGPGTAIYRSSDGGESWEKMSRGIPGSNLGKIGLAISPFNRDVIYAAIELDRRTGGVFISKNRGVTWKKQSNAVSGATGPHYYQELYASPHHEGTLYLMDVYVQISDDHGKTFRRMKERSKHSDSHSIKFRKDDPDYLLVGTDGGIYESFDLAENWRFIANLPITQYYKLAVDDSEPFYYIYGGTQDNGSHGGPSRTDNVHGIRNADWFKILGADGHQTATEPGNPAIVYAESQQGGLHRIDRTTGEQVYIKPQAGTGEPHERFNWDTPILVSPHNPARIYTGSYRVWRSDNRGDSWKTISPDLTKNQERLTLEIMGRVQSWDNAWDLSAMSTYNTITSLAESPLQEGLIYAGTDDGIIQVTEDGGGHWKKLEVGSIKGIPSTAFVNDIKADLFDAKTVYAALDNHKFGDFKPYLIKSTDAGKSWNSIAGNLPERTLVWRLVQDHVKRDLLFAATEFGIYFSINGGEKWIKFTGGTPTISFRDITIQRRENDLVAASFGRSFFVLDDYTPLRDVSTDLLDRDAVLFPVKESWWYIQKNVVSAQGAADYVAENPPFGAVFTYYLKEDIKTLKEKRKEREKEFEKQQVDIPFPGWESLDQEKVENKPILLLAIKDDQGNIVNRVTAPAKKGIQRVSWNLRHASKQIIGMKAQPDIAISSSELVTPGNYSVTLLSVSEGSVIQLAEEEFFEIKPLREGYLQGSTYEEIGEYRRSFKAFEQELGMVSSLLERDKKIIQAMKQAYFRSDRENPEIQSRIFETETLLLDLDRQLNGNRSKMEVGEKQTATPRNRISVAWRGLNTTYGPTDLHRESLELGIKELEPIKLGVEKLSNEILPQLERELKEAGAPWIDK